MICEPSLTSREGGQGSRRAIAAILLDRRLEVALARPRVDRAHPEDGPPAQNGRAYQGEAVLDDRGREPPVEIVGVLGRRRKRPENDDSEPGLGDDLKLLSRPQDRFRALGRDAARPPCGRSRARKT